MKKIILVALALVLMVGISGCSPKFDTEESCLYIKKNGKVIEATLESFTEDYYSEDELKSFMEETIEAYNESTGNKAVKLNKLSVKDGIASSYMTYKSYGDYAAFTGAVLFAGTIEEARDMGYSLDGKYLSVSGTATGNAVDSALMEQDLKVVITNQRIGIKIKGSIEYISNNVKLISADTVSPLSTGDDLLVVIYK